MPDCEIGLQSVVPFPVGKGGFNFFAVSKKVNLSVMLEHWPKADEVYESGTGRAGANYLRIPR